MSWPRWAWRPSRIMSLTAKSGSSKGLTFTHSNANAAFWHNEFNNPYECWRLSTWTNRTSEHRSDNSKHFWLANSGGTQMSNITSQTH